MIFEFDILKSMHDYNDMFDILVNLLSGGKGMLYVVYSETVVYFELID